MAVIKFDVSGSDPGNAKASERTVPKKGVKIVKIEYIKDRRPEKNDLEVKSHIHSGDNKNYPYWDYPNFGESSVWYMDQFLMALGIASEDKRTGQFNPDKYKNKLMKVDTKVEVDSDGDPIRSKIRAWLGEADDVDDESDEDSQDDESDSDSQDDESDSEDEDTEASDSDSTDDYDEWDPSDLRAELKDRQLETKGAKSVLVKRLRESDAEASGDSDSDSDSEDSGDDYDEWDDGDLKAELKDRKLNAAGRRATLIQRLRDDDAKESAFDG